MNILHEGLLRYFTPCQLEKLTNATVGIAGAGGLGSNAALMLVRSGIGSLVLVDHDLVDASNLNRQQYWPDQLGEPKVSALAKSLRKLNPELSVRPIEQKLIPDNLHKIISLAPIWIEALDVARTKAMFVNAALSQSSLVVAASGLCGCGGPPMKTRKLGRLVLVGDFLTDSSDAPPLAPRVTQAAAMLADTVLEFILQN